MKRRLTVVVFVIGATSAIAMATEQGVGRLPAEIRQADVDWQVVGTARLRKYFFHVYDGALWAPEGEWGWDRSFVLDFEYARELDGDEIAERGAREIRELGYCQAEGGCWLEEQKQAFPDVSEGDRLTGWYRPGGPVRFYVNGAFYHEVSDPDFARPFFSIWLDERTSEAGFRKELLGGG